MSSVTDLWFLSSLVQARLVLRGVGNLSLKIQASCTACQNSGGIRLLIYDRVRFRIYLADYDLSRLEIMAVPPLLGSTWKTDNLASVLGRCQKGTASSTGLIIFFSSWIVLSTSRIDEEIHSHGTSVFCFAQPFQNTCVRRALPRLNAEPCTEGNLYFDCDDALRNERSLNLFPIPACSLRIRSAVWVGICPTQLLNQADPS